MKKILIALLLLMPCLCFGQTGISSAKRLFHNNKSLNIPAISNPYLVRDSVLSESLSTSVSFIHHDNARNKLYPLYILDDVVMDIEFDINGMDATTIDSIYVLKDHSATALYGSRGERGVVYIYTKDYLQERKTTYEITVFDPGYETFILTQKPKEYYSISSLKTKNQFMVNEWNYRYRQPLYYSPNIYEVTIDYDSKISYGLEFEYRLYMFFKFMEKQHRISLLNDRTLADL